MNFEILGHIVLAVFLFTLAITVFALWVIVWFMFTYRYLVKPIMNWFDSKGFTL